MIDTDARVVRLFGKYDRVVPFGTAFVLPSLLNGEEIVLVTAVQVSLGEDVITYLASLITDDDFSSEKLYIRSKADGYVRVPEIKMVFSGPKDAKPIENYGWDLFERSGTLRKLLLEDKIEILTESQAKALRKHRPDPRAKDKSLDSILLKGSVKDIIDSEDMFGPGEGNGDEVPADEKEEVLSENEAIMKQYGSNWGKDRNKDG